jgi:hypothetical protein
MPPASSSRAKPTGRASAQSAPARGLLGLVVSTSNDEIKAGSNFSIFVTATNPYDVPVTLYQVLTHVPVELLDINSYRIFESRQERVTVRRNLYPIASFGKWIKTQFERREDLARSQTGTAVALGTELPAEDAKSLFEARVSVENVVGDGHTSIAGISFNFPENPTTQELDAIMRRAADYQRGIIPVTLQPGDSVVRQFVLRTKSRVLFTPIAHTFEIQATYSVDGLDHTVNIPFRLNIRAAMSSIVTGAIIGATLGSLVKVLSAQGASVEPRNVLRGLAVAVLASVGVVAAFARRSSAQPFVSIEDFWGGIVIGFSVGYFGFSQFGGLLGGK